MKVSSSSIGCKAVTTQGEGVIKKVSESQQSIHITINGQMLEVPLKLVV